MEQLEKLEPENHRLEEENATLTKEIRKIKNQDKEETLHYMAIKKHEIDILEKEKNRYLELFKQKEYQVVEVIKFL